MEGSVLILDFGSQYTQLIARRVREFGVYSEIRPCTISPDSLDTKSLGAIILSGGPAGVMDADAPTFDRRWLETGKPLLGICYGFHLMAHHLGGKLEAGKAREYGPASVEITAIHPLFRGLKLGEKTNVWMSHGDHVETVPKGFSLVAKSNGCPVSAFVNDSSKMYGIQFHPEVVHTVHGREILKNFLFDLAGLKANWAPANFINSWTERIRATVKPEAQVICGLSGGVDSAVAAVLVHKAIGKRLHCIFVDNGLLRLGEVEEVENKLGPKGLGLNLTVVHAHDRFLSELKGVTDPETKRKIIGRVFIEVFDAEAKRISKVTHLVQGTLYPDVIESVSIRGPSAVIKSHHNVGGLPERMQLELLEPLRELFKDEVRQLGRDLGMPEEILMRQPFPGPGLAVRIVGEITDERLELVRKADKIFLEEIRNAGWYNKVWQSFAALLPVQSVGVMGDGRTYQQTIALRAVYSDDGMTAQWSYLPEELLRRVSNRIINEVKGINRVVMDISSKPPATIEWE